MGKLFCSMFTSTDGGTTWCPYDDILSLNTLVLSPTDNNILYAGTRGGGILMTKIKPDPAAVNNVWPAIVPLLLDK